MSNFNGFKNSAAAFAQFLAQETVGKGLSIEVISNDSDARQKLMQQWIDIKKTEVLAQLMDLKEHVKSKNSQAITFLRSAKIAGVNIPESDTSFSSVLTVLFQHLEDALKNFYGLLKDNENFSQHIFEVEKKARILIDDFFAKRGSIIDAVLQTHQEGLPLFGRNELDYIFGRIELKDYHFRSKVRPKSDPRLSEDRKVIFKELKTIIPVPKIAGKEINRQFIIGYETILWNAARILLEKGFSLDTLRSEEVRTTLMPIFRPKNPSWQAEMNDLFNTAHAEWKRLEAQQKENFSKALDITKQLHQESTAIAGYLSGVSNLIANRTLYPTLSRDQTAELYAISKEFNRLQNAVNEDVEPAINIYQGVEYLKTVSEFRPEVRAQLFGEPPAKKMVKK